MTAVVPDEADEGVVRHGAAVAAAAAGGVLVSVQSRMNGEWSAITGQPIEAALWSFGSGLVLLTGLLLVPGVRRGVGRIRDALAGGRLRWWQCLGGLGGAFFVATQTYAVPLVDVALFTVAAVAGTTASGLVVDRLGIGPAGVRPVHAGRVAAAALAVIGVAVAVSDRLGAVELALIPVVLTLAAGAGTALQQGTNGRVNVASRHVLSTTWLNFVTGTTLLLALAVLELATGVFEPVRPTGVPWWAWLGGLCGIAFIAIAAWAVKHLGVLIYGLSLLTGQLGSAVVIDLLDPVTHVDTRLLVGVAITFSAAATAAWLARPRVGG